MKEKEEEAKSPQVESPAGNSVKSINEESQVHLKSDQEIEAVQEIKPERTELERMEEMEIKESEKQKNNDLEKEEYNMPEEKIS